MCRTSGPPFGRDWLASHNSDREAAKPASGGPQLAVGAVHVLLPHPPCDGFLTSGGTLQRFRPARSCVRTRNPVAHPRGWVSMSTFARNGDIVSQPRILGGADAITLGHRAVLGVVGRSFIPRAGPPVRVRSHHRREGIRRSRLGRGRARQRRLVWPPATAHLRLRGRLVGVGCIPRVGVRERREMNRRVPGRWLCEDGRLLLKKLRPPFGWGTGCRKSLGCYQLGVQLGLFCFSV